MERPLLSSPSPVKPQDDSAATSGNSPYPAAYGAAHTAAEEANNNAAAGVGGAHRFASSSRKLYDGNRVVALLNRLSGERDAAQYVYQSLAAAFGPNRVLEITPAHFADPSPIKQFIRLGALVPVVDATEALVRKERIRVSESLQRLPVQRPGEPSPSGAGESVPKGDPAQQQSPSGAISGSDELKQKPNILTTRGEISTTRHSRELASLPVLRWVPEDHQDYHPQRGTVLVSGGDGTVNFVMRILDEIMQEEDDAYEEIVQQQMSSSNNQRQQSPGGSAQKKLSVASQAPNSKLFRPTFLMPAVVSLPLGTGNDFAICLGHGSGYTRNQCCCCCYCCPVGISETVVRLMTSPVIQFDRWAVTIVIPSQQDAGIMSPVKQKTLSHIYTPYQPMPRSTLEQDDAGTFVNVLRFTINNYLSFGIDAKISFNFDEFRKKHPRLCTHRCLNKAWYGMLGLSAGATSHTFGKDFHSLVVNGKDCHIPTGMKSFIISNVDSYGGGAKLWNVDVAHKRRPPSPHSPNTLVKQRPPTTPSGGKGKSGGVRKMHPSDFEFRPVSVNDELLEVQGITGAVHLGMLQGHIGRGAEKLAQGRSVDITLVQSPQARARRQKAKIPDDVFEERDGFFFQADGEPIGIIVPVPYIRVLVDPLPYPTFVRSDKF